MSLAVERRVTCSNHELLLALVLSPKWPSKNVSITFYCTRQKHGLSQRLRRSDRWTLHPVSAART